IGTRTLTGFVDSIDYRVDIEDFSHHSAVHLQLNEIARCQLRFIMPIPVDFYTECHDTGALIIVDRLTNATMGAGMVVQVFEEKSLSKHRYSEFEIELNALICRHFPHWEAKNLKELL
ncbi:elongation factor 1-alpha C-terminal domain-related protein, partial [Aeromonas sobria]